MKYFYIKPHNYIPLYGKTYKCNHALYNYCTLYLINNKGFAVIQQHYDQRTKLIRWAELDPWLANDIYLAPGFKSFFDHYAEESFDGLYPTITIRKLMWELKMKPLEREVWEDPQKIQWL